jgi:thymidine kinase
MAEIVRKQYAICVICGAEATRTQRLVAAQDDILVGSTESYEARCRMHFETIELKGRRRRSEIVKTNLSNPVS